ncbi:MAG: dipicolinic acid synthetase subunit A [Candidatus Reconcilbacillus cellulovorans]|uniref:Dipicolinic acid synthetase subunit A n=1 Tax=Candidatus Reconcilbacillus cellulovorans TaxID=1906605 RepID=A0A2A6DZV1_9BACL|nr:MAG: dipicolinic acid synthetase subunit A [Candidatus Reconcilbacillus cellulovorans]
MLTNVKIVMVGGDARQTEVIRRFAELDAMLVLIGFDHLQVPYGGAMKCAMEPGAFADANAVVLPVVGTDERGVVDSVFSSQELILKREHLERLAEGAKVYTGIARPYLKSLCASCGVPVEELLERDDVAIYNSVPTAEGAIMLAIQHTDTTIHGSVSMVVGFGRTGMTLARMLKGLGAVVKVGVRCSEQFARAWECGYVPFDTNELALHVRDVDLLFNTVPTMIITAHVIAELSPRAVIIDLASRPGGTDFRFAEKRGIKAILAPSLPGLVAPKTAGRILADALVRSLLEELGRQRGRSA